MSVKQESGIANIRKLPAACLAAGTIAVGVVAAEAAHQILDAIHAFDSTGHAIIRTLTPRQEVMGELQTAIDSVYVPKARPVLSATVHGHVSVDSYTTVLGVKVPFTDEGVGVTETGTVDIMAPENAIISRKIVELNGSNSIDPKVGVSLTVNADSLYPAIGDPGIPIDPNGNVSITSGDSFFPNLKHVAIGKSPDAKYTAVLSNVDYNYMETECAQAIAPMVQAGIQQHFVLDAQETQLPAALIGKPRNQEVAAYVKEIASGTIPVSVNLVNASGQAITPSSFRLNDSSYVMPKKEIYRELGVDPNKSNLNFSSPCLSKPKAVQEQISLAQGYESQATAVASAIASVSVGNNG
jgi:hypothetical protein